MDNQTIEQVKKELQQPLLDSLAQLNASLKTLSQLQLAKEFYTHDERRALYAEYQALIEEDNLCYQRLHSDEAPDNMTWHDRAALTGESVEEAQRTVKMQARDAKLQASQRISEFQRHHKLIVRLVEAKAALSKGRYE